MYQYKILIHFVTRKLFSGNNQIHLLHTLKAVKKLFIITCVCPWLSSCVSLPPGVTQRDAAAALSAPQNFQVAPLKDSRIINGLMDVFADQTLEALVRQSLRHNLDIKLAMHRMAEAGFNAHTESGNSLPEVTANVAASRLQSAQSSPVSSYTPSLDVSWEIDIWGRLRARRHALNAIALSQIETYQATRDSIAAQVMQGWFDVVTTERLVKLAQSRLHNLDKSAQNSRRNYQAGLKALDDFSAVERDIAQARAAIAANINTHNMAVRALQILMGGYPDGALVLEYQLPALLAPPAAGMPATLLTERPDVRSAWQKVLFADQSVNVAHKEMFPSLTLTGSFGRQSQDFSDLLSGATIWSLAGRLSAPVFNAGRLKNNMHAAQSRAEQAWIRYLQITLRAFKEVEQALDRETLLADQEARRQEAVAHAQNTAHTFENRYKNGLVSILEYLNAQNAVFDIKVQLLNTRNQRLKNRVALALALGKGV